MRMTESWSLPMSAVFKQEAHKLIDALPETANWDELAEKARYLAAVERGIAAADRGEFASPERMKAMFAKWGVDAEA
jgi:predicted transcriptional regulator